MVEVDKTLEMKGEPVPGSITRHVFQFKYGVVTVVPASFGWADCWLAEGGYSSGGESSHYSAIFYQPRGAAPSDHYPAHDMLLLAEDLSLVREHVVVVPEGYRLNKVICRGGEFQVKAEVLMHLTRTVALA